MSYDASLFPNAQADEDVKKYDVEITLIDVAEINLEEESYDLTFWLTLTSDDIDFTIDEIPEINFVNGKVLDVFQEPELESVTSDYYRVKVDGTFYENMDFQNYPASSIHLKIIMQPYEMTSDQIQFAVSPQQIQLDSMHATGWKFKESKFQTKETKYFEESYSQITATYSFEKPLVSVFFQEIFPLIIIGGGSIFIFYLKPTNHDIKVESIFVLLLALIAFHGLVIDDALPPLNYMTLEDKLIIVNYAILVYAIIEILIQRKFNDSNDYSRAEQINKKMRLLLPIVVVGTFLVIIPL